VRKALAALALLVAGCAAERGHSVIVVTLDGTRWQEIFGGADAELIRDKKVPKETVDQFWRPSAEERRRTLMPFLWDTVAREGQLLGNVDVGSQILVTNRFKISYPGYHELLSGFPSRRSTATARSRTPTSRSWSGSSAGRASRTPWRRSVPGTSFRRS
jgi:hypothetical protein